ncbi:MAG: carboxypeptidase regulatory-like domain-containing protein [Pseudomonadota bacterium]
MKLHKPLFLLAAALLVSLPSAYADSTGSNYLNGGVGEEELAMMHSSAKDYPLHITFTEGRSGTYLADVPVKIVDLHGKAVFDLADAGPILYVRLPKGSYIVKAVSRDVALSSKVKLDGKHNKSIILHWKHEPDE